MTHIHLLEKDTHDLQNYWHVSKIELKSYFYDIDNSPNMEINIHEQFVLWFHSDGQGKSKGIYHNVTATSSSNLAHIITHTLYSLHMTLNCDFH